MILGDHGIFNLESRFQHTISKSEPPNDAMLVFMLGEGKFVPVGALTTKGNRRLYLSNGQY